MSPTRREVLKAGAASVGAATLGAGFVVPRGIEAAVREAAVPYRQSVARWCFAGIPLDTLASEAKRIGLHAIDLLSENEWAVPKAHGIACAVSNGPGPIADGWNRPDLHDKLVAESARLLPLVAAAGIQQMIVFSGNRRGMSDGDGITNCIAGLKRIMPTYPFEEAFFLEQAKQFRARLSMPLMLLGGITRLDTVQQGLDEGFDFAVIGRALLREPDLIRRWQADAAHRSPCSHCNKCAPTIYSKIGTTCVERT